MFDALFGWEKWKKLGEEKIIKVCRHPVYDPIEREWLGFDRVEYHRIH